MKNLQTFYTPSRFNFEPHDVQRELLGLSFINYAGSDYDSHKRVHAEIRDDAQDAKTFARCEKLGAKPTRRGAWDHNYFWATQGLSIEDQDEVYFSRIHNREPEFV